MSELGMFISEYRKNHSNLSIRDLAEKCGLSYTYIHKLEKGIDSRSGKPVIPTIETINKLALGMNVSTEKLLALSGISLSCTIDQANKGNSLNLSEEALTDIGVALDHFRDELLNLKSGNSNSTTLFHGKPIPDEGIDELLNAMRMGMELAEMRIALKKDK